MLQIEISIVVVCDGAQRVACGGQDVLCVCRFSEWWRDDGKGCKYILFP